MYFLVLHAMETGINSGQTGHLAQVLTLLNNLYLYLLMFGFKGLNLPAVHKYITFLVFIA